MKTLLLTFCTLYLFIACSPSSKEDGSITKPDLLKGQWHLDLNNVDRNSNSRENVSKREYLKYLNLNDYTFFGNGEGVFLNISSKSDVHAVTEKQFNNLSFKYRLDDQYISLKMTADKDYTKFFKIVDKGMNDDYLEVLFVSHKDTTETFGLYKIGNYE